MNINAEPYIPQKYKNYYDNLVFDKNGLVQTFNKDKIEIEI